MKLAFSLLFVLSLFSSCCTTAPLAYTYLFNGKDLTGWKGTHGSDSYSIKDGVLKVQSTGGGQHLLYTAKKYKDFELVVVSKSEPSSNSGIYFHTDGTSRVKAGWLHNGYEAQLNSTEKEKRKTGSLYAIQDVAESPVDETKWFTMKVRVEGKRIQIWVNGKQTADYTEPENPERPKNRIGRLLNPNGGYIALQAHDTKSVWYFKEVKIREL
ncbi:MAG: DUF1080 domain-containing protein [Lentisphaeraceae bacterium]|nr:DUF1080 domain-containing protein [Lentisphaeraceae bacterium]